MNVSQQQDLARMGLVWFTTLRCCQSKY